MENMELRINLNYNQILGLIRQLPDKDIEKLSITLQSEISSKRSSGSIEELILKAPTWSESDFDDFNQVRNHINKSRIA
jgi:hypothetical protein